MVHPLTFDDGDPLLEPDERLALLHESAAIEPA